jgi:hypothetical protein
MPKYPHLSLTKQSKIPDVLGKNKYSPVEVQQASEDDEEAGQSLIEVGTSDDDDKTPLYRRQNQPPERQKNKRMRLDNNISKKIRKI